MNEAQWDAATTRAARALGAPTAQDIDIFVKARRRVRRRQGLTPQRE